jgi:hypothetical protein
MGIKADIVLIGYFAQVVQCRRYSNTPFLHGHRAMQPARVGNQRLIRTILRSNT